LSAGDGLKFAVCAANFGSWSDPHVAVRAARAAQAAGWDGYFVWDHLAFVWGPPSADPWITLAAVASATEGLTLGTAVTPLPRRRPQVVAQQLATLEQLNGGRVVLGAGLGGNESEFTAFGDDFDPHARARLLDDGLELVRRLWSGPIWIGGNSARALRRAARWDGWIPNSLEPHEMTMSTDELAEKVRTIGGGDGFDVAFNGYSQPDESVRAYADGGATWWFENMHDVRGDVDAMVARIDAGPPVGY
jgi:alkanesulfonate monooxygenase SsuD/methylene tetrahydromethanopterin reductase-like flavin-dependent oxidoreductase (luciferase family)